VDATAHICAAHCNRVGPASRPPAAAVLRPCRGSRRAPAKRAQSRVCASIYSGGGGARKQGVRLAVGDDHEAARCDLGQERLENTAPAPACTWLVRPTATEKRRGWLARTVVSCRFNLRGSVIARRCPGLHPPLAVDGGLHRTWPQRKTTILASTGPDHDHHQSSCPTLDQYPPDRGLRLPCNIFGQQNHFCRRNPAIASFPPTPSSPIRANPLRTSFVNASRAPSAECWPMNLRAQYIGGRYHRMSKTKPRLPHPRSVSSNDRRRPRSTRQQAGNIGL